jgi:hypothetical protein
MSTELPRRIVILVHRRDRDAERREYQIWGLAEIWRSWGIEVAVQHGVARFLEADVVVNHVDLTVVPPEYASHMSRYPVAINGASVDISKRTVSRSLIRDGDDWRGPVIVKTNANYGGALERLVLRNRVREAWQTLRRRLTRRPWRVRVSLPSHSYAVFSSPSEVPADVWLNRHLVVERFLPERDGDLYCIRKVTFFGDRWISRRVASASPVVKSDNVVRVENVGPHPEAFAEAKRLGLDRGRLDYVVHDDRAIVLDANRTNTMGRTMTAERKRETLAHLAPGLRSFWPPR